MKPTAKAMNYALDITRRVPTADTMRDGGTEKKAKTLKGAWIKLNSEMYAFVEEAKTTIVEVTKTTKGCGCKAFTDTDLTLLCEHLIAFDDLKEPPQMSINSKEKMCRVLTEYLFTLGWSIEADHWLYPPLDSPTRLDPVHEDKELDIGVGETVSATDAVTGDVTMVHYKCPKCGIEVDTDKDKLVDWKLNHMEVCKGKPAPKARRSPERKTPTTNEIPKTTKSVDTTSDPEGESNEGDAPTPDNPPERAPVPTPGVLQQDVSDLDTTGTNVHATNELPDIDAVITSPEPGSIVNIARAMCNVQRTELFAIQNADNPFVKNKYADLSSVWTAIRKPITDNGLSVIQTTEPHEGGITLVTTLLHISGETLVTRLSAKVPEKKPNKNGEEQSNIQSLGSTITYLRRYSLAAMIGVCPTDDDGESAMGRGGK